MAQPLQLIEGMGYESSRRCALWVDAKILGLAQELAALLDVDVDTFVESVVVALHNEEALQGRLRSRAAGADKAAKGTVIPMCASGGSRRPSRR